jgi:predicted transcriptional regulator
METGIVEMHKVTVNFPDDVYEVLRELAHQRRKPMGVVLRDAIAFEKWVDDARQRGAKLLLKEGNEAMEIMLR